LCEHNAAHVRLFTTTNRDHEIFTHNGDLSFYPSSTLLVFYSEL
jgi:hypothetical protein